MRRGPIFFVGFPRSGTTVTFEAFSRHPSLGWPSAYTDKFPATPAVELLRRLLDNSLVGLSGKQGQYGKTLFGNRLLPQPNEAYSFWDLHTQLDFSRSFLRGRADAETISRVREAVRKLLKWQGRTRFAAKLTGPPRITFLDSIFPDSQFVHVVRDGRAAVHSVIRQDFWREKGGLNGPFWSGALSLGEEQQWRVNSGDPGVLAALQWVTILEEVRSEAGQLSPGRYLEFRYEDFVTAPHELLREIYAHCGLKDCPDGHLYLERSGMIGGMNEKYRHEFSEAYIGMLTNLMQPMLTYFAYQD